MVDAESQNHKPVLDKASDINATTSERFNSGDSPYATHYRHDAPIWKCYMDETYAKDKKLASLWETALDSLLLFVSVHLCIMQGIES